MESLVLQIGDCNGSATYQMLMNHIFSEHLGVWMDVYLDDIIIYSYTLEDHMEHIRTVFKILRENKFYLSADKMQLFAREINILGHIIDEQGIRMDPHKVDSVANWKVPTSRTLLQSFLGAVGFLAPDCAGIRIPMGVLTPLTGVNRPWRWDATAQRAFDEVKQIVSAHRDQHRVAINYEKNAPWINLVTDACLTGGSGYLSQGDDLETAKVCAFWSGKFNPAQQNYPVHELELLAIVESLKRFRGMLHGARFRICTDHKALQYFMSQK
ncbi:DNA/RNA polymerase, partial [Auricularia subglabra TFB-10046 SS5]